MQPRALLLSGPIGLGHTMMAQASAQVLADRGWQVRTRDAMAFRSGLESRVSARVAQRLMATGGFYDAVHFAHLRHGSRIAQGLAKMSTDRLLPALRADVAASPVDVILSVFATGAAAAAEYKAENPDVCTVVLCTDVCVHRLWARRGTDLFLVTSPVAELSVRRFLPNAHVRIVPPPVRSSFYSAPDQTTARASLGLPPTEPCVLVMDSGWGFGPLAEAAAQLAAAGVHVLAVAGRNAKLLAQLRRLQTDESRVRSFGLTDQIPVLMSAADLVITLPGATTCGEARALNKPLMLLDLMPGHGRENVQHQLELGNAYVCDATPAGLTASTLRALRQGTGVQARSDPPCWPEAFITALADAGVGAPAEPVATRTIDLTPRARAHAELGGAAERQ